MVFGLSALEWSAVILVLILIVYLLGTWNYGEFKKRNMVYPKPSFLVGNMWPFMSGKKSLADQSLYYYNKYKGNRAIGFFNFTKPFVYVLDPEVIKLITIKDFDYFTNHNPFVPENDKSLNGRLLFSLRGQHWRWMRNLLTPAFTSSKMKSMFLLVAQCGDQLANYLQDKCKGEKDGVHVVDMKDLYTRYANDVIATSAFGVQCDSLNDRDNEFYKMGTEATDFGGLNAIKFLLYTACPPITKIIDMSLTPKKVSNFFLSLVTNTMRVREKENIYRPDMIHLLMEAKKEALKNDANDAVSEDAKKQTFSLDDFDITAQAFIFFIAGFDTSSTLLCFLSHLLAVHPDIQERLRQEIDDVLAEDNGKVTYDSVQRMKYLDQAISEALRMYPPVPDLDRECVRDYTVPATESSPSITFKKGDGVLIPAMALQRDPEYYEDPDRFDPDRFSDENKHNIKSSTNISFGSGPRACIGNRFALMEAKIALVSIMRRFSLEVVSKTPAPLCLQKNTFNTHVEGGFWLGIKPRT